MTDKQKTLSEIRDESADHYTDVELCGRSIDEEHVHTSFLKGFDAAVLEMKKRAEGLVTSHKAIAESLRKEYLFGIANVLDSALEAYRKSVEGE